MTDQPKPRRSSNVVLSAENVGDFTPQLTPEAAARMLQNRQSEQPSDKDITNMDAPPEADGVVGPQFTAEFLASISKRKG